MGIKSGLWVLKCYTRHWQTSVVIKHSIQTALHLPLLCAIRHNIHPCIYLLSIILSINTPYFYLIICYSECYSLIGLSIFFIGFFSFFHWVILASRVMSPGHSLEVKEKRLVFVATMRWLDLMDTTSHFFTPGHLCHNSKIMIPGVNQHVGVCTPLYITLETRRVSLRFPCCPRASTYPRSITTAPAELVFFS